MSEQMDPYLEPRTVTIQFEVYKDSESFAAVRRALGILGLSQHIASDSIQVINDYPDNQKSPRNFYEQQVFNPELTTLAWDQRSEKLVEIISEPKFKKFAEKNKFEYKQSFESVVHALHRGMSEDQSFNYFARVGELKALAFKADRLSQLNGEIEDGVSFSGVGKARKQLMRDLEKFIYLQSLPMDRL